MAKPCTMTRQHFAFIADVIADFHTSEDSEGLGPVVARMFANACETTNPNFNRAAFLAACKLETSK